MVKLQYETGMAQTGLLPPLVADYLQDGENLKFLYAHPFSIEAFEEVMKQKQYDAVNRQLLVDVLTRQYKPIGPVGLVESNIKSLLSANTFTVTAAHQPCLLLGPLYNICKIAGAINTANQLKKLYPECHFVPVFWMGSEDHDTAELNHVYLNGQKITWANAGPGAIGRLKNEGMDEVVNEIKGLPVNPDLIKILTDGLAKYQTFGALTQYFVHEIFKEHGLVVIDQDDRALKQALAPVIKEELSDFTASRVLKPALEWLDTNYKVQARPREINFFYLGEDFRERIVYNEDAQHYEVKGRGIYFSKEQLYQQVESTPERFSPNVIYRPLYQEIILPNLAFIGGAGELSYWLELKGLFKHYKVSFPMLVLRNSIAIVAPSTTKKMEKLGIGFDDLFGDLEHLVNKYVKDKLRGDVDLNNEKSKLEQIYQLIIAKAETADVTLKQSAASERQKALSAIESLEGKILKAEKRKQETSINQIRAAHNAIFPDGELMERREGFLAFYDGGFISQMVEALNPFDRGFKVFVTE